MLRKYYRQLKHFLFRILFNLYPPYLGAGIRVTDVSKDYKKFTVKMPLRFYNKNYFGTHFGGSLYSMCDPFFVIILTKNLGKDYIVWDKSASIRFLKPGRSTVKACFRISDEKLEEIKRTVDLNGKTECTFKVDITDEQGNVIAEVEKNVYIRKK